MNPETISATASSAVSSVNNAPVVIATVPTVTTDKGVILSKKDAIALPCNLGIARSKIEKAILSAWANVRTEAATAGREAINACEVSKGTIVLATSKSGVQTVKLIPAKAEKKESAKAKLARLEFELNAAKAELAEKNAKNI